MAPKANPVNDELANRVLWLGGAQLTYISPWLAAEIPCNVPNVGEKIFILAMTFFL